MNAPTQKQITIRDIFDLIAGYIRQEKRYASDQLAKHGDTIAYINTRGLSSEYVINALQLHDSSQEFVDKAKEVGIDTLDDLDISSAARTMVEEYDGVYDYLDGNSEYTDSELCEYLEAMEENAPLIDIIVEQDLDRQRLEMMIEAAEESNERYDALREVDVYIEEAIATLQGASRIIRNNNV